MQPLTAMQPICSQLPLPPAPGQGNRISMFVEAPTRHLPGNRGLVLGAFGTKTYSHDSYDLQFELEGIPDENAQEPKRNGLEHLTPVIARIMRLKPAEQQVLRQVQSAIALTGFLGTQDQQRHVAAVAELLANAQNDSMVCISLRTGRSNSDMAHCLSTLRHTVIVIKGVTEGELLVDPNFRANFEIANAPAFYTAFLAKQVPSVLVGPVQRFTDMAAVMADVMAAVYVELGMSAPPWRTKKALTSKFAPIAYNEIPMPPSTATLHTLTLSPSSPLNNPLNNPFTGSPTLARTEGRVRAGKSGKSAVKSLLDMVLQESALPSGKPGKPVGKAAAEMVVNGQAPKEREVVSAMVKTMGTILAKEQANLTQKNRGVGVQIAGSVVGFAVGSPRTVLSVEAS